MSTQPASELSILIDIRAKLGDLVKSQEAFRATKEEAQSFGNMLKTGLGIDLARRGLALLTGTLRESVGEAFRMAGAIKDQAENLGISTDAYQVLGQVIKEAGGDMGLLNQLVSQNNRSLAEARSLSGGASAAYRTLGLNPVELEGLSVERRLETIGRALNSAKDQTAAYGAAAQIVGTRNLPTLLSALRSLATDGYRSLETAAKAAGQVMERDTIMTLDRAQKQIEKLRQAIAIESGKNIAELLKADPTLFSDLQSGLFTVFNNVRGFSRGLGSFAGNALNLAQGREVTSYDAAAAEDAQRTSFGERAEAIREAGERQARATAAAAEAAQKQALADAEYALAQAVLARQSVDTNPFYSNEAERRQASIKAMGVEIAARERLLALQAAPSLDSTNTEDPNARRLKLLQGRAAVGDLSFQRTSAQMPVGANQRIAQQFSGVEDPKRNPDYLTRTEGVGAGAMQWVTSLGSQGQQVASALQSSLGATVSSISDGLMGWITHTRSFGSAMLDLANTVFKTVLDTFVQIGVQELINQMLHTRGVVGHVTGEATKTAATAAGASVRTGAVVAEAGTTATATGIAGVFRSIMELGPIAGPLVFGVAVAGMLALVSQLTKGFADGGYTGPGGKHEVAGTVHRGEVVWSQRDIARAGGVDAVESMRLGGGYAFMMATPTPAPLASAPGDFTGGGFTAPAPYTLESLPVPSPARARAVSAPQPVAASGALANAAAASAPAKRERLIAIVPDMNSARALQRDPDFESVIVDVMQRRRGEILG